MLHTKDSAVDESGKAQLSSDVGGCIVFDDVGSGEDWARLGPTTTCKKTLCCTGRGFCAMSSCSCMHGASMHQSGRI